MKFISILSLVLFCCLVSVSCQNKTLITKTVNAFNAGDYQNCIKYANQLIEEDPSDYISWTIKGRALCNSNKQKAGIDALNKAIQINPNYVDAYAYRAMFASKMMNFDTQQVINDFNVAIKGNSSDPKLSDLNLIKVKGNFLTSINFLTQALEEYNKYLELDPTDYFVWVYRGRVFRKHSNPGLAIADFNHAISLNPQESFAYEERGFLYIDLKQFAKAVDDFDTLIDLIESGKGDAEFADARAFAYNNRGYAYYKFGDAQKAFQDINQSLQILPTNSYAYRNRALVYLMQGDEVAACNDLQKARDLGFNKKYGNEVEDLISKYCKT